MLMRCAGKAVFATSKTAKGEFLTFYSGELISEKEAVSRETQYTEAGGSSVIFVLVYFFVLVFVLVLPVIF